MSDDTLILNGPSIMLLPKRRFVCPKGHIDEIEAPFTVGLTEVPEMQRYPLCRHCYVEWLASTFPTTEEPMPANRTK